MPGSLVFYPTTDEHLVKIKEQYKDAGNMVKLADFIIKNRNDIKFRFQDRKAIFYTNYDKSLILIDNFWDYWISSKSVDPKMTTLSKNVVGCNRLPHGKYKYQVYLKKDAHLHIDDTQKKNLYEFIERNTDHCLLTQWALIDWFEDKCQYCFGGYFYVTEEQFITPIYMMAQQAIDKVITYRKVKNGSNKKVKR
tara:strand:- start:280 stop:861 length:582 start_codon:yes stop_codon:yes gene_type:complete